MSLAALYSSWIRRRDGWTAFALFAAAFAVLFATSSAVGFVRDESVYFAAAESYARWFGLLFQSPTVAFRDSNLVGFFDFNHEHPVLMKCLFGLSHALFHDALGWLDPARAFRIPALLCASIVPALIYLFGARLDSREAGLFGAIAFLLVPRHFFNAHLACFDMPVAAAWTVTTYLFWRSWTRPWAWLWCGVSFGLALATKHNALFLPIVLFPFALWHAIKAKADRRPIALLFSLWIGTGVLYALLAMSWGPEGFVEAIAPLSPPIFLFIGCAAGSAFLLFQLHKQKSPAFGPLASLSAMAFLGPPIFYLHWPYLWHHPARRIAEYLAFHAAHNHYTWFYLGKLLREPPFPLEYVLVKTALTVPLPLLVPMAMGLLALLRATPPPSVDELLIATNALASILIISHPEVPHFGGVKHWLPSMPFLSILAGAAMTRSATFLWTASGRFAKLPRPLVVVGLWALVFSGPLIASARIHPFGTSYYGELAGGIPGAASLGMQRQFWSNNVTGVLPWINGHAPKGARVWLHEVNGFSFRDYQRNGMLRLDLSPAAGPQDAQLAAYQYHQEFREQEAQIWEAFGTTRPSDGLYIDETPQVVVYLRP